MKITKTMSIFFLVILLSQLCLAQTTPDFYCGDGICSQDEDELGCPTDCRCVNTVVTIDVPVDKPVVVERPKYVDFFIRKTNLNETCGFDSNLDGYVCDNNEDFTNCASDCQQPSLDRLLCTGPTCMWREAWFVRILVFALGGAGIFLFLRGRGMLGKIGGRK